MKNSERYKEQLLDIWLSGNNFGINEHDGTFLKCGVNSSDEFPCDKCEFFRKRSKTCKEQRKEWLDKEYEEKPNSEDYIVISVDDAKVVIENALVECNQTACIDCPHRFSRKSYEADGHVLPICRSELIANKLYDTIKKSSKPYAMVVNDDLSFNIIGGRVDE